MHRHAVLKVMCKERGLGELSLKQEMDVMPMLVDKFVKIDEEKGE